MHTYPTVYTGSFCVYISRDENLILLIERGNNEGFGVPGGYVDIGDGTEQPREGAVRELGEEILFPDGTPVLSTVTPDRLVIVDSGIDYTAAKPAIHHMGTVWHGHQCALTVAEIQILKAHIAQMAADPDYAQAVRKRSHGELENIILITPDGLYNGLQSGTMSFRYPHEQTVAVAVAAQMRVDQKPQVMQKREPGC